MLYGYRFGLTIVVAAATTAAEIDQFHAKAAPGRDEGRYVSETVPDMFTMLSDDTLSRFTKPPIVYEFADQAQADAFVAEHDIEIGSVQKAVNEHDKMLQTLQPEGASPDEPGDQRTIGETHGLDWFDPHDHRTDEQKKQDEKYRQIGAAAAARGELSGESFSRDQGPTDPNARVTQVNVSRNADGSVRIDSAFGVKGMNDGEASDATAEHRETEASEGRSSEQADLDGLAPTKITALDRVDGEDYVFAFGPAVNDAGDLMPKGTGIRLITKEAIARFPRSISPSREVQTIYDERGRAEVASALMARGFEYSQSFQEYLDNPYLDNENTEIDPGGRIAKFHRVSVEGVKLEAIAEIMLATSFDISAMHATMRNTAQGSWIACVRQTHAEKIVDLLNAYNMPCELHEVDKHGEVIVPEEEEQKAPIGPRPWNTRGLELAQMSSEAREDNRKTYEGGEFIFCGSNEGSGRGNLVYIAPRSYFEAYGRFFPGPLDIAHLLPADLKEIGHGAYQSTGRPWQSLKDDLVKKGFQESWDLQMALNLL